MFRQQRRPAFYPQVQQTTRKSGLDKFSTSLDTFQKVLEVVHSTAPYIEKYGPVVQKIPSMYRIYRAIKNIDDSSSQAKEIGENTTNKTEEIATNPLANDLPNGHSSPTLYI